MRSIFLLLIAFPALAQISFTTGPNGLTSLQYGGTEFNYRYGENLLTGVRPSLTAGYSVPGCTTSVTDSTVTKTCNDVSLTVVYTATDSATVDVSYTVQNTGASPIADAFISTIGIVPPQFREANSRLMTVMENNPASYIDYTTGQVYLWNDAPSPDSSMQVGCGFSGTICKNQVHVYSIDPSASKTVSYSLRFVPNDAATGMPLAPPAASPEAYAAYRASYPFLVGWTDHRPIMRWFIADNGKRSATNPRGYLQAPNLNVTDGTFASNVLTQANKVLALIKARPVQPQGLVIWDLEGQEFIHATTYIGDPRVLSQGYAAEMDAVADQLFATFTNAGYKVGVTLRPEYMQWGTVLPSTCHYDKSHDFKDYFIKVDGAFGEKFYSCYDPDGAKWSLLPQGNGGQTLYPSTDPADVTALLISKATYAHSRWGATIFYVDSAVWSGGSPLPAQVFRDLLAALPDCLFIPEQGYIATAGAAVEYQDPSVSNSAKSFPLSWSWAYPNGFQATAFANCQGTCWTNNYDKLLHGQINGDIAIYAQPTQIGAEQLGMIEGLIQAANAAKAASLP